MAVLNVIRANRNQDGYVEKLINNMFKDQFNVYQMGYGVVTSSPEAVIDSLMAVRRTYYKTNSVKVHYLEIFIERAKGLDYVKGFAHWWGEFLFVNGFQSYMCISSREANYLIAVAVNAVSYLNGRLFIDNNAGYIELYQILCQQFDGQLEIEYAPSLLFNPKVMDGNYIHGILI